MVAAIGACSAPPMSSGAGTTGSRRRATSSTASSSGSPPDARTFTAGDPRPGKVPGMANITGNASTEIDAAIDAVWAVVEDVEHWADWQGTLGEVTVTGKDGEDRVSECKVKI